MPLLVSIDTRSGKEKRKGIGYQKEIPRGHWESEEGRAHTIVELGSVGVRDVLTPPVCDVW